ncbi:hypothetical protein QVD17_04304 [Tagetes erecta]|uniref:Uncharacterized protein n=1 Tax=Tagetes erecta TaxID=13708 RepID=A0AAD8P476_TARER|nr:hypothetical protein QVD17_04304 [Tagetes erecta]
MFQLLRDLEVVSVDIVDPGAHPTLSLSAVVFWCLEFVSHQHHPIRIFHRAGELFYLYYGYDYDNYQDQPGLQFRSFYQENSDPDM